MRKLLASVLMLLTFSISLAAQEWTRFSPPDCRCSVSTPVKLESSPQPVDTKVGTYTVSIFQGTTGSVTYVVAWVDYAPTVKLNVQGELEANRDNFIKGIGATLLETTAISLNGSPGILFTAQKDTLFYTSRVYVVGRRPYQLLVATRKGEDRAAEISRFFSSFEVSVPGAPKGY